MLTYATAKPSDCDELADLRAEAMEESLTRLGRFNRERARERFIKSFNPANSRHLLWGGERAGVIVVAKNGDRWTLVNLYLYKCFQRLGIGQAALSRLCVEADEAQIAIELTVLKDSEAIRLYERFGFVFQRIDDVDCIYLRPGRPH